MYINLRILVKIILLNDKSLNDFANSFNEKVVKRWGEESYTDGQYDKDLRNMTRKLKALMKKEGVEVFSRKEYDKKCKRKNVNNKSLAYNIFLNNLLLQQGK